MGYRYLWMLILYVIFNCLLVRSFPFLFVCLFVSCLCICFLLVVIGEQLKVIKLKHFFLYLQAPCVYSFSRFDFSYERYCFYLSNLKFSAISNARQITLPLNAVQYIFKYLHSEIIFTSMPLHHATTDSKKRNKDGKYRCWASIQRLNKNIVPITNFHLFKRNWTK